MEEQKQNKITVIMTILLLILVVLMLLESLQLSEIKDKIRGTEIYWKGFKQRAENESTSYVTAEIEDKK